MRATITIDDALYEKAVEMAGPDIARTEIFREAMKTYVRVQAAKRLATLASKAPDMPNIPRRQTTSA